MASNEINADLNIVDDNGNVNKIFPTTKARNVILDSGTDLETYLSNATISGGSSGVSVVNSGDIILIDNKNTIQSEKNYSWSVLHDLCQDGTIGKYVKTGSIVKLTTNDDREYELIAHVDPYYGTGSGQVNYHHIDFISKDLMPTTSTINNSNSNGSNNSYNSSTPAWIKSKVGTNAMRSFLDTYFNNQIPTFLKQRIVDKIAVVPTRYNASSNLSDDNGTISANLGKLWLLYYKEIWGDNVSNSSKPTNANNIITYEQQLVQYSAFTNDSFRIKLNASGSANNWWTGSARSGHTNAFCLVHTSGAAYINFPNTSDGVPLCFRIS